MSQQRERAERFVDELREEGPPSDRSIKEVIDALRPQLQELAQKQAELAKLELAPVGKQAGIALGLLLTGGTFLLLFLGFFFATGVIIMSAAGFPLWAAAGIITVLLLIIGAIIAGSGASILRKLDPKPHRTILTLQQNMDWLKGQLKI